MVRPAYLSLVPSPAALSFNFAVHSYQPPSREEKGRSSYGKCVGLCGFPILQVTDWCHLNTNSCPCLCNFVIAAFFTLVGGYIFLMRALLISCLRAHARIDIVSLTPTWSIQFLGEAFCREDREASFPSHTLDLPTNGKGEAHYGCHYLLPRAVPLRLPASELMSLSTPRRTL